VVALAGGCRHLSSVSLAHTAVGDTGVCALASACRGLTRLRLDGCCGVSHVSLAALAGSCSALRHLSVHDCCDVAAAALAHLRPPALPSLRTLSLGAEWSRAHDDDDRAGQLHELRARRPELQVYCARDARSNRDLRAGSELFAG
jgi:hypothetical protein